MDLPDEASLAELAAAPPIDPKQQKDYIAIEVANVLGSLSGPNLDCIPKSPPSSMLPLPSTLAVPKSPPSSMLPLPMTLTGKTIALNAEASSSCSSNSGGDGSGEIKLEPTAKSKYVQK
jgi:hypothetical protein